MAAPKILAFAGSTREDSFNKKLVKIGVQAARRAGADVTYIDLKDFPLPIFDQDYEAKEGLPENGRKLKDLFLKHEGLLISSPEYNSSLSGVFKNAIDWVSRPVEGEPYLNCFMNKYATIMSASPGALGGLRGLVHVRSLLGNIHVTVLPHQVSIPLAGEAFLSDGTLKDKRKQEEVEGISIELVEVLKKIGK